MLEIFLIKSKLKRKSVKSFQNLFKNLYKMYEIYKNKIAEIKC